MKLLFEDESFSFETLRTVGFANYGGTDLGEVIVTARTIPEGDEAAWLAQWEATAEIVFPETHGRDADHDWQPLPGGVSRLLVQRSSTS